MVDLTEGSPTSTKAPTTGSPTLYPALEAREEDYPGRLTEDWGDARSIHLAEHISTMAFTTRLILFNTLFHDCLFRSYLNEYCLYVKFALTSISI